MSFDEKALSKIVTDAVKSYHESTQARKPLIIVTTLTSANTEYPIRLPAGCKRYSVKVRTDDVDLLVSFTKGHVDGATPRGEYFTLNAGRSHDEADLQLDNEFTLYVACATAGKVVETVAWF